MKRKALRKEKRVSSNQDLDSSPPVREAIANDYLTEVLQLQSKYPHWRRFFHSEQLNQEWSQTRQAIEEETNALVEKYAWAIPDERCLNIIRHFAPIIEIGAGKGYWARLLQDRGVDIVPFDKFPPSKKKKEGEGGAWTEVRRGGAEVLKQPVAAGRTLFLSYPDEAESMAAACLENYQGDYIIHVGELMSTGTAAGPPVAPFGRTSSADFQVSLAETFHCLLVAELDGRLPISRDCISVWKRTVFVAGGDTGAPPSAPPLEEEQKKKKQKKSKKTDGEERQESAVEFISAKDLALLREAALDLQYSEDQDNRWAVLPQEEILPIDRAAPCLLHLLPPPTTN